VGCGVPWADFFLSSGSSQQVVGLMDVVHQEWNVRANRMLLRAWNVKYDI
jgi:hypothetical protein